MMVSDRSEDADERVAMLAALVDGDVGLAYRFATELLDEGVPFDELAVTVLAPVQVEVGRRWAVGDLSIADEHAASAAINELLVRLGAVAESSEGPTVVVASAPDDAHGLGGRVIASALALEGYRVLFLGAAVPAVDLGDFLDRHEPLALALSCSMPTTLARAAEAVGVAHQLGIPVVGGGRALGGVERATRLGLDAFAPGPREVVEILRFWEGSGPDRLAVVPEPIPERRHLTGRADVLVAMALEAMHAATADVFARAEVHRVLQAIESSLLLGEPELLSEHLRWLRETGPEHEFAREDIDRALEVLADAMDGDLQRAGDLLRRAMT